MYIRKKGFFKNHLAESNKVIFWHLIHICILQILTASLNGKQLERKVLHVQYEFKTKKEQNINEFII